MEKANPGDAFFAEMQMQMQMPPPKSVHITISAKHI